MEFGSTFDMSSYRGSNVPLVDGQTASNAVWSGSRPEITDQSLISFDPNAETLDPDKSTKGVPSSSNGSHSQEGRNDDPSEINPNGMSPRAAKLLESSRAIKTLQGKIMSLVEKVMDIRVDEEVNGEVNKNLGNIARALQNLVSVSGFLCSSQAL